MTLIGITKEVVLSRPLFFFLDLIFRFFLFQHIVYDKFKGKYQRVQSIR